MILITLVKLIINILFLLLEYKDNSSIQYTA